MENPPKYVIENLHGAVLYKGNTHYISDKFGKTGIVDLRQGAWGFDHPFSIPDWTEASKMNGEKLK